MWALGRGFKKQRSVEIQLKKEELNEGTQKQIKIFIFEEFDHGSD